MQNTSPDPLNPLNDDLLQQAMVHQRSLDRVAWNYRMVGWAIMMIAVLFYGIALLFFLLQPPPPAVPVNGRVPNPLKEWLLAVIVSAIILAPLVFIYRWIGRHIAQARRWAIILGLLWTGLSIAGSLRMVLIVPMNQTFYFLFTILFLLNAFLFLSLLLCLRSAMILHRLARQQRTVAELTHQPLQ